MPIRHREEFGVAGYLPSVRGFGTLILGQFNREGNFVYAGSCGSGLSETTRAVILEELQATRRKTCPFRAVPDLRDLSGNCPIRRLSGCDQPRSSRWSIASAWRPGCGTRR